MRTFFLLLFIVAKCVVDIGGACTESLSWTVSKEGLPDLTDDQFQALPQCREHLYCCRNSTPHTSTVPLTCSCATDCETYGDCCWDAPVNHTPSHVHKHGSSCVAVGAAGGSRQGVSMITGCGSTWPRDEVRDGCENARTYNATFYSIPATSPSGVTYYNGYCALCNYDIEGVVFWNASRDGRRALRLLLPAVVQDDGSTYLRFCNPEYVAACTSSVNKNWVRLCETYFAPVIDFTEEQSPVYKNLFCALCNSKPLSALACAPVSLLRDKPEGAASNVPDHAHAMSPVAAKDDCPFWHEDHCYIPSTQFRFTNRSYLNGRDPGDESADYTVLSIVASYLGTACICISVVCLCLKALVYAIYERSRGFTPKCVLCLSCTLLTAYLVYLTGDEFFMFPCVYKVLAVLLHYANVSTFCWTTVLSYDIWKGLSRFVLSRGEHVHLFVRYCLMSWCSPACLVVVCVAIDVAAPFSPLAPQYGRGKLWMTNPLAATLFYLMPMVALALANLGLFVHSTVNVRSTARRAAGFEHRSGGEQYGMDLFLKLALIMGATWILCFLSVFVQSVFTDLIVTVSYGLQGVYLFFVFKDYRYFIASYRSHKMDRRSTTETEIDSSCL